jgi:endonuclease YncB( thermonuclease family)
MWGRFRRWPRFRPLVIAAGLVALAGWLYFQAVNDQQVRLAAFSEPAAMLRTGPAEVLAVSDSDTLLVKQPADKSHPEFIGKVRLLGIDRPKDPAAMEFLKERIAAGSVRIDLDKRRVDRDGRFLAYVYVGEQHLSEELVAAGFARVHTYPGDSMTVNRKLLTAQDLAKREQRGIWAR